jgi:hypothetical protein
MFWTCTHRSGFDALRKKVNFRTLTFKHSLEIDIVDIIIRSSFCNQFQFLQQFEYGNEL